MKPYDLLKQKLAAALALAMLSGSLPFSALAERGGLPDGNAYGDSSALEAVEQTAQHNTLGNISLKEYHASLNTASDGSIQGHVEFTGSPMTVKLYLDDKEIDETTLKKSGSFSFDRLSPGSYVLRFYFKGEENRPPIGQYASVIGVKDTQKPPEITPSPTETPKPVVTPTPEETSRPVVTPTPEETSRPEQTNRPGRPGWPEETSRPENTHRPGRPGWPEETSRPAITPDPDATATPVPQGIQIERVKGGENYLTVTGKAQAGAQLMIYAEPDTARAEVLTVGKDGTFRAYLLAEPGIYDRVVAYYVTDIRTAVSAVGYFEVTAPFVQPTLTVDPVDTNSTKVVAKTSPGVKVTLRTNDTEQMLVADSEGIVRFSLAHTYLKDDVFILIVTYDSSYGEQSFSQKVTVQGSAHYSTLEYGDSGDAVTRLTKRLSELGYPVSTTSRYGSTVREAVRLFQVANGLQADGRANHTTQTVLYSVGAIRYSSNKYPTLVRGDRDIPLIYTLQQRLKDLGYYTIKVDGIFGSGTERAVRLFQQVNGLAVTGKADNATQTLLYSDAAKPLGSGSHGEYKTLSRSNHYNSAVVPLQRRLKSLGYAVGSIDGYFGSQTYRAVRSFQSRNGLTVTGIADPYTQQVLYSSSARPASGSSSSTGYRLLYWGCRGDDVKRLQNALISAGYKSLVRKADGIYGQWTYDAVCAFQKDHGLAVDGIAGKNTQNKLYGTKY